MLRVTSKNRIYFVGKAFEVIESIDELCEKYDLDTPLIKIIDEILRN